MRRFKNFSPLKAFRDLRLYLSGRNPYELLFAFPALVLTLLVVAGFYEDTKKVEVPYKPNIIYAESWPLNRSDAEIKAQQKIDQAKKHAEMEAQRKHDLERQQKFKKADEWLTAHGF
jgi:hypothetical protein